MSERERERREGKGRPSALVGLVRWPQAWWVDGGMGWPWDVAPLRQEPVSPRQTGPRHATARKRHISCPIHCRFFLLFALNTHTNARTLTNARTDTHARTRARAHIHTHSRTHAVTHTHTQIYKIRSFQKNLSWFKRKNYLNKKFVIIFFKKLLTNIFLFTFS